MKWLRRVIWWLRPDLDPRIYEAAAKWVAEHPVTESTTLAQLEKDRADMWRERE